MGISKDEEAWRCRWSCWFWWSRTVCSALYYSVNDLQHAVRDGAGQGLLRGARRGGSWRAILSLSGRWRTLGDDQQVSDILSLETDYLGAAGDLAVSLQRLDSNTIEVTGTGTAAGVSESVGIVLATEGFFDGVVYSKGSLDFHGNVLLEGDIASGGTVKPPDNFNGTYQENLLIDFPPPVFPDEPEEYSGDLSAGAPLEITTSPLQVYRKIHIGNKKKLIINAQSGPVTIQTRYFEMHNNGSMEFVTRAGHDITLVVDEIVLKQVTISGDGNVYLYALGGNIQTPRHRFRSARLVLYLDKGRDGYQANSLLEGLIYGPRLPSPWAEMPILPGDDREQLKGTGVIQNRGGRHRIRRKYS